MTSTLDPRISFANYYRAFRNATKRHGGQIMRLTNGSHIFCLERPDRPRLAFFSGLHGDERSGPLALLEWLAQSPDLEALDSSLLVLPLLNDAGWDAGTRDWNGQNLNRAFCDNSTSVKPPFVREAMDSLRNFMPDLFLDLHEVVEVDFPYVYRYTRDSHDLSQRLQKALDAADEPWSSMEQWDGTTEVFVRRLGCDLCATIEAPCSWPLKRRVSWQLAGISSCAAVADELVGLAPSTRPVSRVAAETASKIAGASPRAVLGKR